MGSLTSDAEAAVQGWTDSQPPQLCKGKGREKHKFGSNSERGIQDRYVDFFFSFCGLHPVPYSFFFFFCFFSFMQTGPAEHLMMGNLGGRITPDTYIPNTKSNTN